jgi:2-dehydropantoate 2-reductase
VAMLGSGQFHRGTDGMLMIENHPRAALLVEALTAAGLQTQARDDMLAVQWSKVLHNLNNAINALSGLPLLRQLSERPYRLCLAACVEEGLGVLAAAHIVPAQIAKVPPQKLPRLLRMPDFLYRPLMKRALKIDAKARSSMQDDLRAGRATEIDELNGAVVRLAFDQGLAAPINARLVALVRSATADSAISGVDLRRALGV